MNTTIASDARFAIFGLLALVGATVAGERFHTKVAQGTTLVRTFEQKSEVALVAVRMRLDGQKIPWYDDGPRSWLEINQEKVVAVTDRFVETGEARPRKLERTFDRLATRCVTIGEDSGFDEVKAKSPLEGRKVLFAWKSRDGESSEKGSYVRSFADEEEADSAGLLERLDEDMDLRGFLPEGEVVEGASWSVDPRIFQPVLSPEGGAQVLVGYPGFPPLREVQVTMTAPDESPTEAIERKLGENLAGRVTATFRGSRDEQGVSISVLELNAHLTAKAEEPGEFNRGGAIGFTAVEIEYDLKGELLWDRRGGHLHALDLSGLVKADHTYHVEWAGGGGQVVDETYAFRGKIEITATVRAKK